MSFHGFSKSSVSSVNLDEVNGLYLRSSVSIDKGWRYINGLHLRPILSAMILCLSIRPICFNPSVIHFLIRKEGYFVVPSSFSTGRKGVNIPFQVIKWNVACMLTGAFCGDEICAPLLPMVACGLVLDEIGYHIMISVNPKYKKLSLPHSVSDPVTYHVNGSWIFLADIVIEKSASCSAVHHFWGGWLGVAHLYEWHSHLWASMAVYKKDTSSASIGIASTFIMFVHSTWTFILSGGCLEGGGLLLVSADAVMR